MTYQLVYDVATTSNAPRDVMLWTAGLIAVTLVWGIVLRVRGRPLHAGVKFLGVVAVIFVGVSALTLYEQKHIAARTDVLVVEGPLVGVWQKDERTKDADGKWRKTSWEGFWIQGVGFVYARSIEQNYFHNGGPTALALHDGMRLRLHYVVNRHDGKEYHEITRVERIVD
jgi:hypothetical protein